MNKDFVIYLDMDGVLCNFIDAVEKLYAGAKELQKTYYGANRENPTPDLVQKYNDFTNAILNKPNFWVDLEWMPDGKELVTFIINNFSIDNIGIISAPMRYDETRCLVEKKQWISNNIPFIDLNNFQLEKQKYTKIGSIKGKHQILIDDHSDNIDGWRSNGGIGILHTNTDSTIKQLIQLLKQK